MRFRKNVLSIRSSPGISGIFGRMESALVTTLNNVCRTWSQCMPGRVLSPCAWKHSTPYKTNLSQFSLPNVDASNAWQMGHNSREGFFLGQELLLDFPAWLDLTSNASNTITMYQLPSKFKNAIWFFKTCWWLTGLCFMPLNHQEGI